MSKRQGQTAEADVFDNALEVFARGFSFTRSFTHPYVAKRTAGMWVLRDGPRTTGDARNEEWIAHGLKPEAVDRMVRKESRGKFAVCFVLRSGESDGEMRAGFKALGYRLGVTEPLMVHPLQHLVALDSPATIEQVTTHEMMQTLNEAVGKRQILPQYLTQPQVMRQYAALLDGKIVGWVRSIIVGDATWCSNMHVVARFRRRGIGKALLSRMLRDDKANGAMRAVLLASHTGAKLYPVVGYEQIGLLYLYTPRR